ncbi:MAG: GNAT family N-acetyltransferase [Mycobacteriaceae bacterium]|nr:GNAT family N-acetyltransferase [Mycobacteriaceae bacterium]
MVSGGVLTGQRVLLRPPRLDDAEALFERIASDPEVTRYLSWIPHPDVTETRRVISELFNVGYERTWLVEIRESREVVGLCGWRRPVSHAVELGYCLARRWWGRGIMSEVLALLLDALQRDPAVFRVWAVCHVDNTRSARLLERAGLSLEGRLTRYGVFPNLGPEPRDTLLFAKALR